MGVLEKHPLPWRVQMDLHLGDYFYIYDANNQRVYVDNPDEADFIVRTVNAAHEGRIPITHPGEVIRAEFEEREIHEFPARSRFTSDAWGAVCEGEAPVTPEMASELQELLGISAQFWLNMQQNYDRGGINPDIIEVKT